MDLQNLFDQYAQGHQHPGNKFFHFLGIPTIIASLIILIYQQGPSQLFWIIFTVGWIFQFIGHAIERTVPEFLKNPIFLIVGPLFFLQKIKNKLSK